MIKFIRKVSREPVLQAIMAITCFLTPLTSCRKNTSSEHIPLKRLAITIETIRKDFYGAGPDKKLVWKLSDSLEITLQPDWKHVSQSTVSDSVEYRFIPLKPVRKTAKGIKPVKFVNFTPLLLVKNGKEFYQSGYYPDSTSKGEANLRRLPDNGKLAMHDMVTERLYIVDYKDGIPNHKLWEEY